MRSALFSKCGVKGGTQLLPRGGLGGGAFRGAHLFERVGSNGPDFSSDGPDMWPGRPGPRTARHVAPTARTPPSASSQAPFKPTLRSPPQAPSSPFSSLQFVHFPPGPPPNLPQIQLRSPLLAPLRKIRTDHAGPSRPRHMFGAVQSEVWAHRANGPYMSGRPGSGPSGPHVWACCPGLWFNGCWGYMQNSIYILFHKV